MKYINTFNIFNESFKDNFIESNIIPFLIRQERDHENNQGYQLTFDKFELIEHENKFIIKAFTKLDRKGNVPDIEYITYTFDDYINWLCNINRDDSISKKSILLSFINELKKREMTSYDSFILDALFSYKDSFKFIENKVNELKNIFKKYKINDIDLRITEYIDEFSGWNIFIHKYISIKGYHFYYEKDLTPTDLMEYLVEVKYKLNHNISDLISDDDIDPIISIGMSNYNDVRDMVKLSKFRDIIYNRLFNRLKRFYPNIISRKDDYNNNIDIRIDLYRLYILVS